MSVESRFWKKVERRGPEQCWPWLHARDGHGYGLFRMVGARSMVGSHRVAWMLTNRRAIPVGMHVLHRCDQPLCCNPGHLFLGTNADNVADKVAKGRSSFPQPRKRGERHPLAKLTQAQVDEIRARATGTRGEGKAFAEEFGVSRATITNVLKRKVWA